MSSWASAFAREWDRFFFGSRDLLTCDLFRVHYGLLLAVYGLLMGPDLDLFYGETGWLDAEAARAVLDSDAPLWLTSLAPTSWFLLHGLHAALLVASAGLFLGVFPRASALLAFVLLVAFHHRNVLVLDGEDVLFRLFALFLVFMPSGDGWAGIRSLATGTLSVGRPWALRLVQIQVGLVYFSAGAHKLTSADWTRGHAFHYITRLDDLYGFLPVPEWLLQGPVMGTMFCWTLILFELCVPFALFSERARRPALVLAVTFHLGLAYAMNLYLFPWIMIVGLLAFTRPSDWRGLGALVTRRATG